MLNRHPLFLKINILTWLILLTMAGCLPKPKPQTGDFCGKVIDAYTREPVPGVTLKIGGTETVTDIKGKFAIAILPPGDYPLTLERDWYYPLAKTEHHIGKQDSLEYSLKPLPLEGKILYSGDETGNWEIYELNLKDRMVTKLSDSPSSEVNPVKYSDSLVLLQSTFKSNNRYNYDLFLLDRNSRSLEFIYDVIINDENKNDQNPSSTISGNIIIFQSNGEKIYSYNRYGNAAKEIISKGQNPVVSPDGTQIAYADTNNRLCVANIDGTGVRIINHPGKINNPSWSSRNGEMIAVELWLESGGPRYIYIMDANGNGEPKRVTFGNLARDQHKHPCWSSDNSMIFFSGNIAYSSRFDIYGIRVSDGLQGKMSWVMVSSRSGSKEYPSWSE
jgi:Tol biopolymer transport system component